MLHGCRDGCQSQAKGKNVKSVRYQATTSHQTSFGTPRRKFSGTCTRGLITVLSKHIPPVDVWWLMMVVESNFKNVPQKHAIAVEL